MLVIMTEWNEFRQLDLGRVKELLKSPVIIDTRNIYEPERMKRLGFSYECVGRKVGLNIKDNENSLVGSAKKGD